MKKQVFAWLFSAVMLGACNTSEKILYLQDMAVNQPEVIQAAQDITVQPLDKLSISVFSKEPQLAALFNLTCSQNGNSGGTNERLGYTIDNRGNIDFPVLGTLHVEGKTKNQIARLIKQRLIDENLVKDPVVTVEFMNLSFSVLGEVSSTTSRRTASPCWKPSAWRAT